MTRIPIKENIINSICGGGQTKAEENCWIMMDQKGDANFLRQIYL